MVTAVAAPAIRTRRKARYSDTGEAKALLEAMWHLRYVRTWVPVFYGGRIIGEVRGDPERGQVRYIPREQLATGMPYNNYDDVVKYKTAEQRWLATFTKLNSTSVVIDNWYDAWGSDCNPQRGDWSGTARTARQFTDQTPGALYHGGAVSPKKKYLNRACVASAEDSTYTVQIYDRVLSYDACTMAASTQTMTNTLAATRYINSGDPGLQLFIEADTAHGGTNSNLTAISYTNNAGTAGQLVPTTPTLAKIISIAAPTTSLGARSVIQLPGVTNKSLMYIPLAAGDTGMRSIQSFTWGTLVTGTCSFVLQYPLLMLPGIATVQGQPVDYDLLNGIEAIGKRVYDDACLSILYAPHNTAKPSEYYGFMEFGWS